MQLWNAILADHGLKSGKVLRGISIGSYGPGQTCFLIPVRVPRDEEVREGEWDVVAHPNSGKPQIIANRNPQPGTLAVLSAYNRVGLRLGSIYVLDYGALDRIFLVGYAIGGSTEGAVTWDEAVVLVPAGVKATFYLENVGPPNTLVHITDKEVNVEPISQYEAQDRIDGEPVRIDDPRIPRWTDYLAKRKETHAAQEQGGAPDREGR